MFVFIFQYPVRTHDEMTNAASSEFCAMTREGSKCSKDLSLTFSSLIGTEGDRVDGTL